MKIRPHSAAALAAVAAIVIPRAIAGATPVLPANTGINWNLTAAQIGSSCSGEIAAFKKHIAAIEAIPQASWTWQNSLGAVETAEADFGDALIAQTVLNQIAPDKSTRDASTACQQLSQPYVVEISSDPRIYAMAQRFLGPAGAHLSAASRKLAEIYVEGGRRSGAGLTPSKRKQVNALFNRLNDLERDFILALDSDATTIAISVNEAKNLTPAFLASLKPTSSGYEVPVNESTVDRFMSNETSPAARQRYYFAFNRRAGLKNIDRLEKAIAIRDQLAHLLGFPTWAAYKLDGAMAKEPARVTSFLADVDAALLPKARKEIATLRALKKSEGDTAPWAPWDYAYYENQLVKTRYSLDQEAVRQYFPVDHVIASVLAIYQTMLGVRFGEITPADAWAPGVREFSIADARSGKPIGWFYLDLYPRPGKYGHFANFPFRAGRILADGSYQKPVAAIIGNWPVGAPGKAALLSHDDVVVFFHEFGHCMHGTLSAAPYESLYGTNVRQDFVEAPSQMLENWMWQPSILRQVSSSVQTHKPLPAELIRKMIALKHVADGAEYTTEAFFSSFDMTIHSSGPKVDVQKVWRELRKKMTTSRMVAGTYPAAGFPHLMSGYDAGYYGYLWSLVFAQDMFTKFQAGGLESPVVGMEYRKDILEPGASVEPDVLLRNFLGRPVSYKAFYRELGITR